MPVVASQTNGETNQFIGAQAQILQAAEATWGTAIATAARHVRNLPGETLDQNVAIFQSKQIRGDRLRNPPIRGTIDPGGSIPFELSQDGWNWALYSLLLPSAITTTGPTGGVPDASTAPTITGSATVSMIPTGTYYYKYTGVSAVGETKPSAASAGYSNAGNASAIVTFAALSGATTYNIYRSTTSGGVYGLVVAGATGTSATDSTFPSGGQPPIENTTNQIYTQIFNAGTTGTPLPVGFSLEKQFLGLATPVYELFAGGKVDKMQLNFKVNGVVEGSFDTIFQSFAIGTSANFTNSPVEQTYTPYAGSYVELYEAGSTNQLGLCTDLTLTIDNQYKKANGYVLGSQQRQNLKPGTRMIDFTGKFMFQDASLYNKAVNGTNSALKIIANGPYFQSSYYHQFQMGTIQFTPNGSAPKIHDDGPLEITLRGQAMYDEATNTDLQMTIVTSEATITG